MKVEINNELSEYETKYINFFIAELTELCRQYGLYIKSDGSNKTPWVVDENDNIVVECLRWNKKYDKYE